MFKSEHIMEVVEGLIKITHAVGVYAPGFEPGCNCTSDFTVYNTDGLKVCHECGAPSEG